MAGVAPMQLRSCSRAGTAGRRIATSLDALGGRRTSQKSHFRVVDGWIAVFRGAKELAWEPRSSGAKPLFADAKSPTFALASQSSHCIVTNGIERVRCGRYGEKNPWPKTIRERSRAGPG